MSRVVTLSSRWTGYARQGLGHGGFELLYAINIVASYFICGFADLMFMGIACVNFNVALKHPLRAHNHVEDLYPCCMTNQQRFPQSLSAGANRKEEVSTLGHPYVRDTDSRPACRVSITFRSRYVQHGIPAIISAIRRGIIVSSISEWCLDKPS
ncbi:hypothetical protein B0H21DRAFT_757089 [Amylocystis lapponica]|nr:hypothetical protein B0H21DRAFT_757089 [Amylocystis lapponica]